MGHGRRSSTSSKSRSNTNQAQRATPNVRKVSQERKTLHVLTSGTLNIPRDDGPIAQTIACPARVGGGDSHRVENLIDVLRLRAAEQSNQVAFAYVHGDQSPDTILTYGQLERRARAIAACLQGMGLKGQRVLLAYPHGVEFIAGFFGCLFAGCTAVPTSLPHRRTLDRFRAIAIDSGARLVLSSTPAVSPFEAMARGARQPDDAAIAWLSADEIPEGAASQWERPAIGLETVAMLQYTSGSTSQPKGVMLTHGNLMHNTRAINAAFSVDREVGMFWLPVYHDMGLVGGVLAPIVAGIANVLMAPELFLQQPIDWLAAISKHRATISGGPNFAYDLCVRRITDEQRATLDLTCWTLAFVGAEPIRIETLERFAAAFAPCGFSADAFYPCYGLAEATLMVSGAQRSRGAVVREFSEAALTMNCVRTASGDAGVVRRLVSCGSPIGDLCVAIVDPQTCEQVAPDRAGEIWVAGSSVGQGYWRKPDQTHDLFRAHLTHTGEGPFLRTGDLGFVSEGQLFVIGRRDDLLIIRGANHHPQDIEATARKSHPLMEVGLGAAFAVEDHEDQRIVLVHEIARGTDSTYEPALQAACAAVLAAHDLALHSLILVRAGTIPRTTSGKVQRRACRTAFLAGELKTIAEYHAKSPDGENTSSHPIAKSTIGLVDDRALPAEVVATICQHALTLGGAALRDVSPDTPLAFLGLDSLRRVELAAMVERSFCCRLRDKEFTPEQTLGQLSLAVTKQLNDRSAPIAVTQEIPRDQFVFTEFPEYRELKRYERMLKAVAGENPYFHVDHGRNPDASCAQKANQAGVNFSNYDYIGMAHEPVVAAAGKVAIDRYGTGAGASRLISGDKQIHRELEQALAAFLGTAAALVFVSGHATNVTTIGHLMGPEDLIVHDILAHNSIIQGARLSGATRRVFAHNDWRAMDALLSEVRRHHRRVLIAIEGAYSMDGDFPDLPRFIELKHKHRALMLIDEAHSLGTMGATGRGIGEHFGVCRTDVDLWMGTLSKSLASCGGYIAGSAELVEYLAYTAPGFVYSVGMAPSSAASALAALIILQSQPQRVTRLAESSTLFLKLARARGLDTGSAGGTPVIPIMVGNSIKSLRLARALFDRGISVQPILHPAVPEHSARLRFFMTINHTEKQIHDTVNATADILASL